MDRKLRDMKSDLFKDLPAITDIAPYGSQTVYLRCYNRKGMNWFITSFDQRNMKFFAYTEDRSAGPSSAVITLKELLSYDDKGPKFEIYIDESWKPMPSKEVPEIKGYIVMMSTLPEAY
jgi:hypothetical protein